MPPSRGSWTPFAVWTSLEKQLDPFGFTGLPLTAVGPLWLYGPPPRSSWTPLAVLTSLERQLDPFGCTGLPREAVGPLWLYGPPSRSSWTPFAVPLWLYGPPSRSSWTPLLYGPPSRSSWTPLAVRTSLEKQLDQRVQLFLKGVRTSISKETYMSHDMLFPTMWHFDKRRLRRPCAAFC